MHRRFDYIFQNGQVAPKIEALKDHGQFGANALELFFVGRFLTSIFQAAHLDQLAMNMHGAGIRCFKKVDAAQKGTFARTG